jgi:hypothetical protein
LIICIGLMLLGIRAKLPDPGVQTVSGDTETISHLGHTVTTISHLTNCLNLEFFGIAFAAHGYLSDCHFGWLKGV